MMENIWYCAWCGAESSMMGHYSSAFYLDGVQYKLPSGAHTCSPKFTRLIEQEYGRVVAARYREKRPEYEKGEFNEIQG